MVELVFVSNCRRQRHCAFIRNPKSPSLPCLSLVKNAKCSLSQLLYERLPEFALPEERAWVVTDAIYLASASNTISHSWKSVAIRWKCRCGNLKFRSFIFLRPRHAYGWEGYWLLLFYSCGSWSKAIYKKILIILKHQLQHRSVNCSQCFIQFDLIC